MENFGLKLENAESFFGSLFILLEDWFKHIKALFLSITNKRGWDDPSSYPSDVESAGPAVTEE